MYKFTLFFNLCASWRWVVNATPRPLYPWERNTSHIVQEAWWAQEPVMERYGNLAPYRSSSPDSSSP